MAPDSSEAACPSAAGSESLSSPGGFWLSIPLSDWAGPSRGDLFTGRSRNPHPRTWPEPGPLPDLQPPTAITAAPRTGGPRVAKNGKSRSEWPPSPPKKKKARSQRRVLCFRFQQFRFPWTARGRRIPSGHKESTGGFDLGSAGSASASSGGLSVLGPGQRPGRRRRARAGRRGSPDGTSRRLPSGPEGTPRRPAPARMERETLAGAPSPSPRPGRRPGAARATATRGRRGRGAEPDTHPATPSARPRRLRAPHLRLPPGKGGG